MLGLRLRSAQQFSIVALSGVEERNLIFTSHEFIYFRADLNQIMDPKTLLHIIVVVLIVHLVAAIGFLAWKMRRNK